MPKKLTNNKIIIENIPDFEDAKLVKIEKNYFKIIVSNIIIFFFLLSILILISFTIFKQLEGFDYIWVVAFAYIFFWPLNIIYSWYGFNKRFYCFRDHDVIYKSGVLKETLVLIPYNRIQHIALHQGLFSRHFGLASLQFYTAGGVTTDISIHGLSVETAMKYKELISKKIQQQP